MPIAQKGPTRIGALTSAMLCAASLLVLSGCVRLGAEPPPQLLSLQSDARVEASQQISVAAEQSLAIVPPTTPRALDNVRVAVRSGATAIAYVKDAQWSDSPRRLFGAVLSETVSARTGRLVVNPGQYAGQSQLRLSGDLSEFSIDADRKLAIVTFDATLVAGPGEPVRRQRFTASAPLRKIDAETVAPALNSAANSVASQVADWIGKP